MSSSRSFRHREAGHRDNGRHDDSRHHDGYRHDGGHKNDRGHHHDKDAETPLIAPETEHVTWTLGGGGASVQVYAALDSAGNVVFDIQLTSGKADLTGFFLDLGNDGGAISTLGRDNALRGRDSDGDRLDGFDVAEKIGTVGGRDADTTSAQIVVALEHLGVSKLSELASAELGIRATGAGRCGADSIKLADTGTHVEPEPAWPVEPIDKDFPTTGEQANVVTLVFGPEYDDTTAMWSPPPGDTNNDWYYTVRVAIDGKVPEDLDVYIEELLQDLSAADANLDAASSLKGAFIQAPGQDTDFFYYGSVNYANGEDPDPLPHGFAIDPATGDVTPPEVIDMAYIASVTGDEFIFA